MADILKNIITFGAHGRIQNKENEFKNEVSVLEQLNESLEEKVAEANLSIESLVSSKVLAVNALKLLSQITKNIKAKDREIENSEVNGESLNFKNLGMIDNTINALDRKSVV